MTKAQVEAPLRHEKEKDSLVATCLTLKPLYQPEVFVKPYSSGYSIIKFCKFYGWRGNRREHVARFLDSLGPFTHDMEFVSSKVLQIFN